MNAVLDAQVCPLSIKYRFIDRLSESSELMVKGQYFEHCLLGSTRDGNTPEIPKLKMGGKSQGEKDIDALVDIAREIIERLGIDIEQARVQVEIADEFMEGHIDMVANDFEKPGRQAIYDVKYTETKFDDRWSGWADLETKVEAKRQARHYVYLWHKMHGEYLPYYFLIFGKSGWVRVLKCTVSRDTVDMHVREITLTSQQVLSMEAEGWQPRPSYEKCRNCYCAHVCDHVQVLPDIEKHSI